MRHRAKYSRNLSPPKPKKRAPGISRRLSGFIALVESGHIRPVAGLLQDASAAWEAMSVKERLERLWRLSGSRTARHALNALERAERESAAAAPALSRDAALGAPPAIERR